MLGSSWPLGRSLVGSVGRLSVALLFLSACGGDAASPPRTSQSPASEQLEPSLQGPIELPSRGFALAIECWGEGSPTTVLEAGSADDGIGSFSDDFLIGVAEQGTACTYDRLGTGLSDYADPEVRRTIRDQSDDLNALLQETDVPTPYVLVGSSFGGLVILDFAQAYPDDVAAMVLLDVPAANGELTAQEAPDAAWDHPDNIEHVDALAVEHAFAAKKPNIPPVPLRVVTASDGDSSVEDQSYWMSLSPKSVSIVLDGGHVIYEDDPDGVVAEIHEAIRSA